MLVSVFHNFEEQHDKQLKFSKCLFRLRNHVIMN